MNLSSAAAADLITREVRSGVREGEPTRIAIARRTYPTDQGDLWDAVTSPERIPRWFLPVTGDLSEGGRYQLEGNAGGVVQRCREPESFAVTWEMRGQVSWLEVTLTAVDVGTQLELAHEAHVDPELWSQFGPGAVGLGWDLALWGLGRHVESGEALDPTEGAAFATTPEGTAFVEQAARGWADSAIDDGDEPRSAREAAGRSVAFYTTAPDAAGS